MRNPAPSCSCRRDCGPAGLMRESQPTECDYLCKSDSGGSTVLERKEPGSLTETGFAETAQQYYPQPSRFTSGPVVDSQIGKLRNRLFFLSLRCSGSSVQTTAWRTAKASILPEPRRRPDSASAPRMPSAIVRPVPQKRPKGSRPRERQRAIFQKTRLLISASVTLSPDAASCAKARGGRSACQVTRRHRRICLLPPFPPFCVSLFLHLATWQPASAAVCCVSR
ncbi:hypothetical protein B0H63DRAFT_183841 [Podospora didyma]|uniref:Uncharacterized protein n=1 Tax=Podospora didyma TaxID=330526 RepID=A0AAE0NPW6_9PEZI|nr:hypothetical protein B0H63DRAFT_183841 [Podospora didyma]